MDRIKDLTGIERSPTQVRSWMKKIGLKYRKTGQLPAKADPHKQQAWLTHTLEPILAQVQAGKAHLLFMDSAHFVMGWAPPAPSFAFYGVLPPCLSPLARLESD